MLIVFEAVLNQIARMRKKRSLKHSLLALEREVNELVLLHNPKLAQSLLMTLFYSEVRSSRVCLQRGQLAHAQQYRDFARKTRAHVAQIATSRSSRRTRCARRNTH